MAAKKTSTANVSKDNLMHFYREMLLIRRFEEKAGQLYIREPALIIFMISVVLYAPSFCHLSFSNKIHPPIHNN